MNTIQGKDGNDIPIYDRSGIGQPQRGYCIQPAATTIITIDLGDIEAQLGAKLKYAGIVIQGKPIYVNAVGPVVGPPTGLLQDNRSTEMVTEARGQWMTRLYGSETELQIEPSAINTQIYIQFWT